LKKVNRTGKTPHAYYPVFLDLRGKDCLVVGGGKVAERKVLSLLRAGADVRVVSPKLTARLEKEKSSGRVRHSSRGFRKSDLKGAFLVIAATDSEEENRKVSEAKDMLVNVVDRPELCSFIVPSTVRRGPLQLAISTSGASPAMARAIREELEELYGPGFGAYLKHLEAVRAKAVREIKDRKARERRLKGLASRDIIKKLRKGSVSPNAGVSRGGKSK
jgi:precorrin-2 dehydrogenase/sirohydrochlorin ferrochelatase